MRTEITEVKIPQEWIDAAEKAIKNKNELTTAHKTFIEQYHDKISGSKIAKILGIGKTRVIEYISENYKNA